MASVMHRGERSVSMHDAIRGQSTDLHELPNLPDGQEMGVETAAAQSTDPLVQELRAFRTRLLSRWGRPTELSSEMIREDRDR